MRQFRLLQNAFRDTHNTSILEFFAPRPHSCAQSYNLYKCALLAASGLLALPSAIIRIKQEEFERDAHALLIHGNIEKRAAARLAPHTSLLEIFTAISIFLLLLLLLLLHLLVRRETLLTIPLLKTSPNRLALVFCRAGRTHTRLHALHKPIRVELLLHCECARHRRCHLLLLLLLLIILAIRTIAILDAILSRSHQHLRILHALRFLKACAHQTHVHSLRVLAKHCLIHCTAIRTITIVNEMRPRGNPAQRRNEQLVIAETIAQCRFLSFRHCVHIFLRCFVVVVLAFVVGADKLPLSRRIVSVSQ
mmetsp:Transcript_57360/g.95318  ORF Transcript_57360/g.95318 Transcript_57360/m.95318 type:complete len:307 (+) Transcript_57360:582-1502(+)